MQVQNTTPCAKTRHTTYTSLTSIHPLFAQLTILCNPKSYILQCISIGLAAQKWPFLASNQHSHVMHVSWTHPTQNSTLRLDWFSRSAQLTADSP